QDRQGQSSVRALPEERTRPSAPASMPQARERGPEVAHTPVGPGLNAPPGVPGPPWPSQERASARTPGPLVAMPHPWGLAFGAPFLWRPGRRGRGFVDEGRESPASRVAAHTPRRPTPAPQNAATLTAMKSVWRGAEAGCA